MNDLLRRLIDLLEPHLDTIDRRQAQLRMAFGLRSPLLKRIVWEGDTQTFVVNAAHQLHQAGELTTFLESIREQVGTDIQEQINALIADLQSVPPDAFTPVSTQSPILPIFLSYSRSNRDAAIVVYQDLQAEGFTLWRDIYDIPAGAPHWWGEIRAAIDGCSSMVLCLSLAALRSTVVGDEWNYARSKGKRVIPVVIDAVFDHPDVIEGKVIVPVWMRHATWVDLRPETPERAAGWQNLLTTLRTPYSPKPVHITVKASQLPHNFVPRPREFEPLVNALAVDELPDALALTATLRGAGGYGKTTLAKALCRDWRVSGAFPDGIFWVTLGERLLTMSPEVREGELVARMLDLVQEITGDRPNVQKLETAQEELGKAVAGRRVLLVIDDAWAETHVKPFLVPGRHHATVITTRFEECIPKNTLGSVVRQPIDQMNENDAVALLTFGITDWEPERGWFAKTAQRLGKSAQLLGIINSAITDRLTPDDKGRLKTLKAALSEVDARLDHYGVTAFQPNNPEEREKAFGRTLEVGIERLELVEQERYRMLGIFPDDVAIPLLTLGRLWNMVAIPTADFCEKLAKSSLVQDYDEETLTIHDVTLKYLRQQMPESAALHNRLLETHRPAEGWHAMAEDEPYLWWYLAYHLIAAGKSDELRMALLDYRYLQGKLNTTAPNALIADCDSYLSRNNHETIWLVRSALSMSAHVLGEDKGALAHQLVGRLMSHRKDEPLIRRLTEEIVGDVPGIYPANLDSQCFTHDQAGGALLRTLTGHTGWVSSAGYSPDGRFILSTSGDKTIRVWEAGSGALLHTLTKHMGTVFSAEYSPDGQFIVSVSDDQTLRIWEVESRALVQTLKGHTDRVTSAGYSPDGRFIVSASGDKTVRVWEAANGASLRTLERHTGAVWSAGYSPDGRFIASASEDKTVRVWEAGSGMPFHTFKGHTDGVNSARYSPDGRFIVSASWDKTVRVWEAESGMLFHTFEGHTDGVNSARYSPDGRFIVSASEDKTVRVWETESGMPFHTFKGHTKAVHSVGYSPNGQFIVSAGDKTVRVWEIMNTRRITQFQDTPTGHTSGVRSVRYSPDGWFIVSTSGDQTVRVWEAMSGVLIHTLEGHTDWVRSAEYSPDGRFIVSAGDQTVWVWEAVSGVLVRALTGHTARVLSARHSLDGQFIVSASEDKTVRVWAATSGALIAQFEDTPTGRKQLLDAFPSFTGIDDYPRRHPDGQVVDADGQALRVTAQAQMYSFYPDIESYCAAWAPDGRHIVAGDWAGRVLLLRWVPGASS